jgi:serine/threonine protein phosphatase PrpC
MLMKRHPWAAFSIVGTQGHQADRVFVEEDWLAPGSCIGIVTDGHGEDGGNAAEYASRRLPALLRDNGYASRDRIQSLTHACALIDEEMQRRFTGGTTLTMLDRSPDRLVVAHVGDSRAALVTGSHFTELTRDHQDCHGRLTRSLGDRGSTTSSTPDVRIISPRLTGTVFVLLATDGVWRSLDERLVTSSQLARLLATPDVCQARNALRDLIVTDPYIENASALLLDVSC